MHHKNTHFLPRVLIVVCVSLTFHSSSSSYPFPIGIYYYVWSTVESGYARIKVKYGFELSLLLKSVDTILLSNMHIVQKQGYITASYLYLTDCLSLPCPKYRLSVKTTTKPSALTVNHFTANVQDFRIWCANVLAQLIWWEIQLGM